MSAEQMRHALMNNTKYGTAPKWQNRVKKMSDSQVIAVYFKMLNSKELS